MAGELPASSLLPGAGESQYNYDVIVGVACTVLTFPHTSSLTPFSAGAEEPTTEPLDTVLADVRSMQSGLPSIGDHLHQLSVGSAAPPGSSSAKV